MLLLLVLLTATESKGGAQTRCDALHCCSLGSALLQARLMGRGSCQAELRLFARALCCCRWLSPVPRAQRTHKHRHPKLQ